MPILSRNANIRQKLFEGATLLFLLLGLPIVVKAQSVPICAAGQNASQHGFQCSLGGLTFSNFATDPPTDPLAISAATDKSGSVELSFLSAPGVFDFPINGALSQVSLVGSFASVCEGFTGSLATPCAGKSLG